jgi:hypothetical protein
MYDLVLLSPSLHSVLFFQSYAFFRPRILWYSLMQSWRVVSGPETVLQNG